MDTFSLGRKTPGDLYAVRETLVVTLGGSVPFENRLNILINLNYLSGLLLPSI
jgi:hypothetical protein